MNSLPTTDEKDTDIIRRNMLIDELNAHIKNNDHDSIICNAEILISLFDDDDPYLIILYNFLSLAYHSEGNPEKVISLFLKHKHVLENMKEDQLLTSLVSLIVISITNTNQLAVYHDLIHIPSFLKATFFNGHLAYLLNQPNLRQRLDKILTSPGLPILELHKALWIHMKCQTVDQGLSVYEYFDSLYKNTKHINNKAWLTLQLARRLKLPDTILAHLNKDEEPVPKIEKPAFEYYGIPLRTSIKTLPEPGYKDITIRKDILHKSILNLHNIVKEKRDNGDFDVFIKNLELVRKNISKDLGDPIFTLSTGRSGTTSLHQLFQNSNEAFSYHSYAFQIYEKDLNHLFYRILTNNYSNIVFHEIIDEFVAARTAEILYAYSKGRVPVFTGHWDTVFAPIWSVLLPNAKFIYLHRNEASVFKSIYTKNQFTNNQLRPLRYNFDQSGIFTFSEVPDLSLTKKISWYLYASRLFGEEFLKTLSKQNGIFLSADNLFNSQTEELSKLKNFLNFSSLTFEQMQTHFETPINSKNNRVNFRQDSNIQIQKMHEYIEHLDQTGILPDS